MGSSQTLLSILLPSFLSSSFLLPSLHPFHLPSSFTYHVPSFHLSLYSIPPFPPPSFFHFHSFHLSSFFYPYSFFIPSLYFHIPSIIHLSSTLLLFFLPISFFLFFVLYFYPSFHYPSSFYPFSSCPTFEPTVSHNLPLQIMFLTFSHKIIIVRAILINTYFYNLGKFMDLSRDPATHLSHLHYTFPLLRSMNQDIY